MGIVFLIKNKAFKITAPVISPNKKWILEIWGCMCFLCNLGLGFLI